MRVEDFPWAEPWARIVSLFDFGHRMSLQPQLIANSARSTRRPASLWETTLPFAGNATYEVGGRQFVVIYATGGKGKRDDPTGGVYVAFALPGQIR